MTKSFATAAHPASLALSGLEGVGTCIGSKSILVNPKRNRIAGIIGECEERPAGRPPR